MLSTRVKPHQKTTKTSFLSLICVLCVTMFGSLTSAAEVSSQSLRSFVENNRAIDEFQKLERVNHFFNRMRFEEDSVIWGEQDYWATPQELLKIGAGDCEDFAIAKYYALIQLGVDESKLRITYVWNDRNGIAKKEAHMVLTYRSSDNNTLWVLDVLTNDIQTFDAHQEYEAVYGFNNKGLWMLEGGSNVALGSPLQIDLWRSLKNRMENEVI